MIPSLTVAQAEKAIRSLLPGHDRSTITKLTPVHNTRFSYAPNVKSYIADISNPSPCSSFITIAHPTDTPYPLSLSTLASLLSTIRPRTQIPIPSPILDTSLSILPYHLLLTPPAPIASTSIVPLSTARASGSISEKDNILIDMHIATLLAQLHIGVQNDWFGVPTQPTPPDPSYSWQESFTALFEDALSALDTLPIPSTQIRTYLSRAIAASLFEDVDTPSLVWFTGSEDDIYVFSSKDVPHLANHTQPVIAAILPSLFHAVWGDPLMESFFIPLDGLSPSSPFDSLPSTSTSFNALIETYIQCTKKPLLSFPRQRTKRIWYTLYLALTVWRGILGQGGNGGDVGGSIRSPANGANPNINSNTNLNDVDDNTTINTRARAQWCAETVKKCVLALDDAPNF